VADQQVDEYGGTIFNGAGDVRPQEAFAQMRAAAPAMRIEGSGVVVPARLELRIALRVWHSRIPHHRVKPGAELVYTVGVRPMDSFPMVLGESI
jgi:hypothetical protein